MRLAYASRDDGSTWQETFLACASNTYDDTPQLELVTHTPIASVSETVSIVTTPTIMLVRLKSMQVYKFEVIYLDF